jgi:hypothetical protein
VDDPGAGVTLHRTAAVFAADIRISEMIPKIGIVTPGFLSMRHWKPIERSCHGIMFLIT